MVNVPFVPGLTIVGRTLTLTVGTLVLPGVDLARVRSNPKNVFLGNVLTLQLVGGD